MASAKKILKYIFSGIVGIVIIILTILFVLQVIIIVHFDKIIESTLKETVVYSTDELYSLDFKNLSINVFTGSVTAEEVYLKADTNVYRRLKEMKLAPSLIFNIYTPKLKVSRVNLYNAYFEKHLDISGILLDKPEVSILNEPENKAEKKEKKDPLDAYSLISKIFSKAGVDKIVINDGVLKYKKIVNNKSTVHKFSNLTVNFSGVLIDSTAYSDPENFLYSDDINFVLNKYSIKLPDSLYLLSFEQISLSTKSAEINFKNILLKPGYGKFEFAKVKGDQTDRINAKIKEASFKKIDLRRLLDKQLFKADEVLINEAEIEVFRDKQIARKSKAKKELPQATLKKLDFLVDIKKVRLRNFKILYEEIPEKGGEGGKVKFTNVFARITDIKNDPLSIANGQTIWMRAEGHLMGKGLIKAKFRFPLNNKDLEFNFSGSLYEMNFEELNPVVKPLASIELKGGKIKRVDFDVRANDKASSGKMKFYYNDLKIQILNQDKEDGGLKEKFGSFIANNFIVESDNPKNGSFRVGTIDFERDMSRSIFNYWWKSLLSGIKPSIGITKERQSSINQFKKKMESIKKKREERKLEKKTRKNAPEK